jgi:hypothetical protein
MGSGDQARNNQHKWRLLHRSGPDFRQVYLYQKPTVLNVAGTQVICIKIMEKNTIHSYKEYQGS